MMPAMSGIPAGAGSLLGKRLGKYEILALLALGGTAEIYLARIGGAAGFEKYVVVKCLHDHLADDPEFVKMFLDEARLAAHLDHSNIVQTMELGEHENRYYMVMEFLAGLSLAMVVRRAGERLPGGRLPVPLVAQHRRAGVRGPALRARARDRTASRSTSSTATSRRRTSSVSFEGVVKVVDFGIAKAELRETKTQAGTIKGKFAYMSPEQCVATNVDRRTDVFALGVIVHELLTGRRLFKRNSPYETYQAVIECAVEPPSKLNIELDPALDEVVMQRGRQGQGESLSDRRGVRRRAARLPAPSRQGLGRRRASRGSSSELRAGDRGARRAHARADLGARRLRRSGVRLGRGRGGQAQQTVDLGARRTEDVSISLATERDHGDAPERRVARRSSSVDLDDGRSRSGDDDDDARRAHAHRDQPARADRASSTSRSTPHTAPAAGVAAA